MPLTPETLALHYSHERIAVALNVETDVVDTLLGEPPADADPDRRSVLAAAAVQARTRLAAVIAAAAGEVAAAVATRYRWADAEEAPVVTGLVADRTMARLHGDVVPEDLEERVRDSRMLLAQIAKGARRIVDAGGVPVPGLSTVRVSAPPAVLSGPGGLLDAY